MKLFSFFLLLVTAHHASAQFQPQDEKRTYQLKYEKYRKARTAGVIMTVAGALVFGDLLNKGSSANSNDLGYSLETLAAEGLLGGGITLAIIGTKKMKKYRLLMDGIAPDINVQRYYKYRRMQSTGLGLVASGIVFGAIGISKLNNLRGTYRYNTSDAEVGVLMVLGGTGLLGVGIPLSIRGTSKMKYYQQKIGAPSLSLGISTQTPGLALSYRF
ncbi:MAG TPA: hypothetical protein VL728_08315 [Cyclobacteriaceae bacterium]|jgi:hypothetical protein|nr:hypothetical protein [Cyclobacteriaceae bacterium]